MQRAAPLALLGDAVGLRQIFLETVHLLRTAQVPLEDLCVQVTLHKSPPQYRRGGTREEPYEVLLGAGRAVVAGRPADSLLSRARWRAAAAAGRRRRSARRRGHRVLRAAAVTVYCQQFAQAFRREDFVEDFPPARRARGPFDEPEMARSSAVVQPIAEAVL